MKYKKILLDIDSQRDFFSRGGSCYSPESLEAGRNVRRVFRWARRERVPALSAMLRTRRRKRGPLAEVPHCVEGTEGERRLPGTVINPHVNFGMRSVTDLPRDVFEQYRHVLIEMRHTDIFAHDRVERLLTELEAGTFILCGAGSAHGILQAVGGLRHRHFEVILAADAILDLGDRGAEMAWLRMLAKGSVLMSTDEIVAGRTKTARVSGRCSRRLPAWRRQALTG